MKVSDWRRVLLWLVFVKAAYLAGVYAALCLWPAMDTEMFHRVMQRWPRQGEPVFASHFATWDAAHYLYLSEVGYAKDVHSCAFYPLWPLLIRWFSVVTGGSHLAAGMILANVFSVAGWMIFHQLAAERYGEGVAGWALGLMILFPGSVFYQFIYSEPLFVLLVMVLWLGLERGRYGWVWAGGCLLPLARGVGVFCVLPIGWHLLRRFRPAWMERAIARWAWAQRLLWSGRQPLSQTDMQRGAEGGAGVWSSQPLEGGVGLHPHRGKVWRSMLAPLLGWVVYLSLMWHWTGNPLEGIQAQKHWGVHSISNLFDLPKFVMGLFSPTELHAFSGSVLDRCVFILLVYTLPVQWRLGKDLLVWTYVLGVLPAMSGTFTSFTRFASCAFPMFIALAVFLSKPGRRWLRTATIVVFAVLHVVLVWRFVNFRWAG
jgi:hypothetical protein